MRNGNALKVAAIQGQATVLESLQSVLTADLQLTDLTTQLNDLLGLPLDTKLELDAAVPADFEERSREEYVETAWSQNPQIKAAEDAVERARAASRLRENRVYPRCHRLCAAELPGWRTVLLFETSAHSASA